MEEEGKLSYVEHEQPGDDDGSLNVDNDSILEQKRLRYKQNTHYRSIFSWWVIIIVSVWILATIAISFLEGFGVMSLPVAAFGTLLATTTANILGLAYIVLKGMFPSGGRN